MEYVFPLEASKFINNQTVCVGKEIDGEWDEELCETEVRFREIACKCNEARAQWVSVWTNKSRIPGPQLSWLQA